MSKSKKKALLKPRTTRRTTAQRPIRTPRVPVQLCALAALVDEGDDHQTIADALTAVTKDLLIAPGDYPSSIHEFITAWAETRNFKEYVAHANQVDPNLAAGLQNAYGIPALIAGIAVGYVMLGRGGAR